MMPSERKVAPTPPLTLTTAQRTFLLNAKAWWQEGDRALDYLAEKAQQENALTHLHTLALTLRNESDARQENIAAFLRHIRQITGNHALNRTRETTAFADAVVALLWGDAPLPERLTNFIAQPALGTMTAAHLLYTVFPERFPFVTPTTRALIAPTRVQMQQARLTVAALYGLSGDTPVAVRDMLADFALYEAVLRLLGLTNYTELNAILTHAKDMPRGGGRRRAKTSVREEKGEYAVEANEPPNPPAFTETDLIRYVETEIVSRGFTFPPLVIRSYYIALKAKPFVILTGLSGTGKTRLTRLLADALTGDSSGQYLLTAVRPDWHDSSPLLGYHNLLTDRYSTTPFLEILHRSAQPENRERLFFVCLDEMNLARVEHYFSDVLSAMETEEQQILLHEGRVARLSPNLFLTGSVNMDEATYPFSRKVLDRANTIEFTEVNLQVAEAPSRRVDVDIPPLERQRLFLAGCVPSVQAAQARLEAIDTTLYPSILGKLSAINALLTPRNLHFGYRVRDEVLRFVAASFTVDGKGLLTEDMASNVQTALDLQILQKVLPRLTGTSDALDRLLQDLLAWAIAEDLTRTQAKLARMRRRATEDGFVTFYEQ